MVSFSSPTTTTPDGLGAFLAHSPYSLHGYAQPAASGALAGYTLGVKDLYDVAGLKTGAGSPDWLAKARDAQTHAAAVSKLIDAGVRFVGKTLTDEMAWSLNGENAHYGTPINPAARDRIPGGSSAGSASAVAGGMIDIGLGSDTGGSVRLPASYCGIWGLRPTHGRIDTSGAVALAQSFDTVGWFARCADVMAKVGAVLLPTDGDGRPVTRLLLARDMFARVDEVLRDNLVDKAEQLAQRLGWTLETIELAPR
ncbi:MAG: amidase family protein, partial [Devosiaceae bacterium]